jgi:predicted acetyltransferase
MGIEIRSPSEDEFLTALRAGTAAFAAELEEGEFERHQKVMPVDRFLVAYDDGRPVATAAAYPFELTIPGGTIRTAGVTWIAVMPSHRRRGILTQFMQHQFNALHEAGEPVAILWTSESAIYGRFGYGISAPALSMDADRGQFQLRDDPGATGTMRLIDADEAANVLPPIYDRVRRAVPGMLVRTEAWWRAFKLADPKEWRGGAGPKFFALYERDGEPEGYTTYRVKDEWEQGMPRGQVRVLEVVGVSQIATREIWRFLFGIDLVTRVRANLVDPGSPLALIVSDPRSLGLRWLDGLWLRLVDVEASLRGRSYAADDTVVLEVHDTLCPWNEGRYRVGPSVGRADDEPDLELDVGDLASVYLGAFDFHALARAERVRELRPGSLERASALFRTTRPPFCPEVF